MSTLLHMSRVLDSRPEVLPVDGVALRHFDGAADIPAWLDLRHRAFARERVGVGRWDRGDFEREFLGQPWWRPQRMWLAVDTHGPQPGRAVGSVTAGERGEGPGARPTIHWLAVLPEHRRRGVARMLIAALEQACWDAGRKEVVLETHSAWIAAARFYQAVGYEPIPRQSAEPR